MQVNKEQTADIRTEVSGGDPEMSDAAKKAEYGHNEAGCETDRQTASNKAM